MALSAGQAGLASKMFLAVLEAGGRSHPKVQTLGSGWLPSFKGSLFPLVPPAVKPGVTQPCRSCEPASLGQTQGLSRR